MPQPKLFVFFVLCRVCPACSRSSDSSVHLTARAHTTMFKQYCRYVRASARVYRLSGSASILLPVIYSILTKVKRSVIMNWRRSTNVVLELTNVPAIRCHMYVQNSNRSAWPTFFISILRVC